MSRYLAALRQEIAGVRLGQDIEAIHRMRVASRRMRSALPLFETCYAAKYRRLWDVEIRQVTRALGQARDSDVQIERLEKFLTALQDVRCRSGVRRLALRLKQKRAKMQAAVVQTLDELERSQALESLDTQTSAKAGVLIPGEPVSYSLYNLAKVAIQQNLDAFLGHESCLANPEAVAEIHQMRIAAKKLRYTLEIFGPIYANELKSYIQTVKMAQEMLGEIHDCDAWALLIPAFLEKERQRNINFYGHAGIFKTLLPGITFFQESLLQSRSKTFVEFTETWQIWKSSDVWGELVETIDLPMHHKPGQEFYPPAAPALPVEAGIDGEPGNNRSPQEIS
jgi:CHAD domain-containing protein